MHEFDVAAGLPCPFCGSLERCPRVGHPDDECLEIWPLSRPASRKLPENDSRQKRCNQVALSNAVIRAIVERWERGAQITDDEYLTLARLITDAEPDEAAEAYTHIMSALLMPKLMRCVLDGAEYYGLDPQDPDTQAAGAAACQLACVIFPDETTVHGDISVPVPSHFERVALEAFKAAFWEFTGVGFIALPDEKEAFKTELEREWWKVLRCGNGFHGFTVVPRIRFDDLVRYQQLGGGDDLVSWSISNWLIWCMKAFPPPVQTVVPEFADKAYGDRLMQMYEPLVGRFVGKLLARFRKMGRPEDAPPRSAAADGFRAVLRQAIEDYDFMYRKADAMISSVGAIGAASSPEWRSKLDERFAQFGLPLGTRDVVHVGFTGYVVGVFEQHLREHYPLADAESEALGETAGTVVDGGGEATGVFGEESSRMRRKSDAGDGVPIALEREGIKYLYIRQMAFACGVTVDQLRNWDRRGYLKTLRVGEVDPGAAPTVANWRIYPYTAEQIERIRNLAEERALPSGDPARTVLSRRQAAKRLGVSTRTLDNWCRRGKIKCFRKGLRVFIPETEVERIERER